jgi:hypothetical protein
MLLQDESGVPGETCYVCADWDEIIIRQLQIDGIEPQPVFQTVTRWDIYLNHGMYLNECMVVVWNLQTSEARS